MRALAILMIGCLLSFKSTAQMNDTGLETCKMDIVIIESEILNEIEGFFEKEDFYLEGKNQYYMYEIVLDKNLEIKNIKTVFENNKAYSAQVAFLIKQLSFQKIDERRECNEYVLPFIVQARLKKLLYPRDKTFYEVDFPIE